MFIRSYFLARLKGEGWRIWKILKSHCFLAFAGEPSTCVELPSVSSIVIQVSWHGRRWWKELGDPEKGFYGWVRCLSHSASPLVFFKLPFSGLQQAQPSRLFPVPGAELLSLQDYVFS